MIVIEEFGDITQIKMGRDYDGRVLYWVAAYLVDGLLIDTGCSYTAEELLDCLEDKPVKQAFITHYHEDHIGGCALLQNKLNIKILANSKSLPLIENPPPFYLYQELTWGYPAAADIQAFYGGELRTEHYTFKVVNTPGHSPDHTVVIEPDQGWCFTGDLFTAEKIKVLRADENIEEIIESMQKLLCYETNPDRELTLFTSLGKIVPQGREAIRNFLNYLEIIKMEAGRLQAEEGCVTEEIVERLFGGESTLANLTDNHLNCKNLINALLKERSH